MISVNELVSQAYKYAADIYNSQAYVPGLIYLFLIPHSVSLPLT